jgi:hypothetical protein
MRTEGYRPRRFGGPTRRRGRANRAVWAIPDWNLYRGPRDSARHCRPPKFNRSSVRLFLGHPPEINLDPTKCNVSSTGPQVPQRLV